MENLKTLIIGICTFTFFIINQTNIVAQEKLTSYLGHANQEYVRFFEEVNDKSYFITNEGFDNIRVYEFDPVAEQFQLLFIESRQEGYYISDFFSINDRIFCIDQRWIYEVDLDSEKFIPLVQYSPDEDRWAYAKSNGELIFLIETGTVPGSPDYQISVFDPSSNSMILDDEDPKIEYSLSDDTRRVISEDRIILQRIGDMWGLFNYTILDSSFVSIDNFQLTSNETIDLIYPIDTEKFIVLKNEELWLVNLETNAAELVHVTDENSRLTNFVNHNDELAILVTHGETFNEDQSIYFLNLETGIRDTFDHPVGYFGTQFISSAGIFFNDDDVFSFLNKTDKSITPLLSENEDFFRYLGSSTDKQSHYFSIRDNDNLYHFMSVNDDGTDIKRLFDGSGNPYGFIENNEGIRFVTRSNLDIGTLVYSITEDSLQLIADLKNSYVGIDFRMEKGESSAVAYDFTQLYLDLNNDASPINFVGDVPDGSFKQEAVAIKDDYYRIGSLTLSSIFTYEANDTESHRLQLSHPIEGFFVVTDLFQFDDRLYTTALTGNYRHICQIDTESGELDCLLDENNLADFNVWGDPFILGGNLGFNLYHGSENNRSPFIIRPNIQESYLLSAISDDSEDRYIHDVMRGKDISIFKATPSGGEGGFYSDGTNQGTGPISGIPGTQYFQYYKDGLFFIRNSHRLNAFNESDKSVSNAGVFDAFDFRATENGMYFINKDDQLEFLPDGNSSSQILMEDIIGGSEEFIAAYDKMFILRFLDDRPYLYASDGTESGTYLLVEKLGRNYADPEIKAFGDAILFSHYDDVHGSELWISDGTPEGTKLLHDVNPGIADSYPFILESNGDHIYFTAKYGTEGRQLFRVNRTEVTEIVNVTEQEIAQVSIYPNPSSDSFQVKLEDGEKAKLTVLSLDGKLMHQDYNYHNGKRIASNNWPSGNYYIYLKSDTKIYQGILNVSH